MPGVREQKTSFHTAASADANGTVANVGQMVAVSVQITGTFTTAVVYWEGTIDGSTWVGVQGVNLNTGAVALSASAAGLYMVPLAGLRLFRARLDWTSGTSITVQGIATDVWSPSLNDVYTIPHMAMVEGGLTELVGINEEVNTDDYSGSVGVALGGTYSGEILSFTFHATEDGTGAVQDSAGWLLIFDADPSISSGDTSITAAEWITVLGRVRIEATDWLVDANGGVAHIYDTPIPFHALSTLYFAWFHTDAADLNDGAGDDEQLEVNFWYRRDS